MKPTSSLQQRWLVATFAMCLMLSQALWLLHRVAHYALANPGASVGSKTGIWVKAVLPDHPDERSCAQYDQLSHADLLPGCQLQPASFAEATFVQAMHVASSMAAQAAGFLARGPPAID